MKRLLSVLLLTAMLTACGTGTATTTPDAVSGNSAASDAAVSGDVAPETEAELDYSDFVFPEETDTLVVYSSGMLNQTMNPAIKIFEVMYPHINVDYRVLSEEEHGNLIRTEIPAGTGPDLVFSYGIELPDIYKPMATGVFCDLNPYLYNDEEFIFEDYIKGTFNCGEMQGRQYILPIQVDIPVISTAIGILGENGIEPEDLETYDGFLDACATFRQNNPDSGIFNEGASDGYLTQLYDFCGLNFIDYSNNTLVMDKDKAVYFVRLSADSPVNGSIYSFSDI